MADDLLLLTDGSSNLLLTDGNDLLLASSTASTLVAGSQATETDTPNAGAPAVRLAGQTATESDTANAGTIAALLAGQTATETDTANAGGLARHLPGSQATETTTPNPGEVASAFDTSTSRDPRGTATDPLRLVRSRQTIGGARYDVLTCGHRYARATQPMIVRDENVEKQNERRCPECVS